MAPEVAAGEAATESSDLYSVGCVLYELLTGRVVFDGIDPVAEISAHLAVSPPRVRELRPDVPGSVDALVAALLAKRAQERPASARTVYETLLPYVRMLPPLPGIVARRATPSPESLYARLQSMIIL
jgi:serine/threonine protein kinase